MEPIKSPLRDLTARGMMKARNIRNISRSYFPNSATVLPAVPPASAVSRAKLDTRRHNPTQPGGRSSMSTGPRRNIHIHAITFIIALRASRFKYFRSTMISRPLTHRGRSAYACKTRLTQWTSAWYPPGYTMMRFTSPKRCKREQMLFLKAIGGRLAPTIIGHLSSSRSPSR